MPDTTTPAPEPERKDPFAEMDPTIRPGGVYMVRLLMKEPCTRPAPDRLGEVLTRRLGRVELPDPKPEQRFFSLAALDRTAKFKDASGPALFSVMDCEPFDAGKSIDEMHRAQLWDVGPKRDEILSGCRWAVTAFDTMGGGLDPIERADLLMDFLEALLELYPSCEAVYCINTGKLLFAGTIRSGAVQGLDRYIKYTVNARFFNISGTNSHVVDTLGLSLLFIEDLQYYFHDMDPNWVVGHAYNAAAYILQNGRPIKEGDTIDGITDGRLDQSIQWPCHFRDALIRPARAVLDIHMNEYASGGGSGG